MWRSVKLFILRWLTKQALKKGWYYRWSRVYQFLFERGRIRKCRIPAYTSLQAGVERTVGRMRWKKDVWVMLFDAVSHPHATLSRHLEGLKAGDCDDVSLYAAWAIADMMSRGFLTEYRSVGLLSIPWLDEDGKCGGHNVCVVSYVDRSVTSNPEVGESTGLLWAHISNWHSGMMQACDDKGRPFRSVSDIVSDVLSGWSRDLKRTSLGWAMTDRNLNLIEYNDGRNI